jgi:hypothetical protein
MYDVRITIKSSFCICVHMRFYELLYVIPLCILFVITRCCYVIAANVCDVMVYFITYQWSEVRAQF